MKTSYIITAGLGALVVISAQAYTYTFNNKSDKKATVRFQLELDLTTNNKYQDVTVAAMGNDGKPGTASISIPEWYRAGLCMNLQSIRVKFENDKDFRPVLFMQDQADFDSVMRKGISIFTQQSSEQLSSGRFRWPRCGDITFDVAYVRSGATEIYPILLVR
jgi:hypothetical protein